MQWQKLGKLFDPTAQPLPHGCVAFAKSPQALVCADCVRIYFCAASKDDSGKLRSHVLYADYDFQLKNLLRISSREVLPLGKPGCYDEHGVFPFNVLRDGNVVRGYISGWSRRVSVSADMSIGYAESSDDGMTFVRRGDGPILTASLYEPFLVGDGFVQKYAGTYYMWYIYGQRWIRDEAGEPQRVYKLSQAESADGINWRRNGRVIIPDVLDENECHALPTVLQIDGRYHMLFCYRPAFGFRAQGAASYRLGYAFSDDLQIWHRDDARVGITLSPEGWDSEMMCYPHLFAVQNEVYLLYNGNAFGKYGFGAARLTGS